MDLAVLASSRHGSSPRRTRRTHGPEVRLRVSPHLGFAKTTISFAQKERGIASLATGKVFFHKKETAGYDLTIVILPVRSLLICYADGPGGHRNSTESTRAK